MRGSRGGHVAAPLAVAVFPPYAEQASRQPGQHEAFWLCSANGIE